MLTNRRRDKLMRDKNPLFSIIVPVFNVKDFLEECINSALKQSYSRFELILVDDGSTDGSEVICDRYAESYNNIRVIHKKNGGQSSARNAGVEAVEGEYFIFVDSDDYIAPNTLDMFKKKIEKNGQLDVILSECMYNVEPDGCVIDVQRHLNSTDYEGIDGQEAIRKMGMEWSPCGKCFRTEYWCGNQFKFLEGRISEDLQLIDRVTLGAKKVAMVSAHYYYRWKIKTSTMHLNYKKLVEDTLFVLEDWNNYLMQTTLDKDVDALIRTRLANMLEHTVMGNVFYVDQENREVLFIGIERCSDYLKYDRSIEGKLIMISLNVFGTARTCYILNKIKTIRKRKQSFV